MVLQTGGSSGTREGVLGWRSASSQQLAGSGVVIMASMNFLVVLQQRVDSILEVYSHNTRSRCKATLPNVQRVPHIVLESHSITALLLQAQCCAACTECLLQCNSSVLGSRHTSSRCPPSRTAGVSSKPHAPQLASSFKSAAGVPWREGAV